MLSDLARQRSQKDLFRFESVSDIEKWRLVSDSSFGGLSSASFRLCPDRPGTAIFSGVLSSGTHVGSPVKLRRSGFANLRAEEAFDLEGYPLLALRVKGDGRSYIANIQTDSWLHLAGTPPDVWQAIFHPRKGEWCEVQIPLSSFIRTSRGRVISELTEMDASKVVSVGIAAVLTDAEARTMSAPLDDAAVSADVQAELSEAAQAQGSDAGPSLPFALEIEAVSCLTPDAV
eukprot:jgi/Mesvir1/17884/Mv12957-RA.1